MPRKSLFVALAMAAVLCLAAGALAAAPPADTKKHTKPGQYVTAQEAYAMWQASQDKVKILDCRTPEEYVFVGHAPMAHNVPSRFLTYAFDADKKDYVLKANENFVEQVKARFKAEDTILVMCRSGQRSAVSVNLLAEAGFKNVYNIVDGFEGEKEKDKASPNFGKRTVDGWRNSQAPWTYDLDPALVYQPDKK